MSTSDDLFDRALNVKLAMDDLIRTGLKDTRADDYKKFSLKDFETGDGRYMDGNGDYISKEEAKAEVEWLNGRYKL